MTKNINASVRNTIHVKAIILGILLQVVEQNGKYLASITENPLIMCDKIIDAVETKTIPKR